jgi:hypothetical protein
MTCEFLLATCLAPAGKFSRPRSGFLGDRAQELGCAPQDSGEASLSLHKTTTEMEKIL